MVSHAASTFLRLNITPTRCMRQPGFITKTAETVITLFIPVAIPRKHTHVETGTAYYISILKKDGDNDPRPGPGSSYHGCGVLRRRCLPEHAACGIRESSMLISWTSTVQVGSLACPPCEAFPTQGVDLLKNAPPLHTTPRPGTKRAHVHTYTHTLLTTPHVTCCNPCPGRAGSQPCRS